MNFVKSQNLAAVFLSSFVALSFFNETLLTALRLYSPPAERAFPCLMVVGRERGGGTSSLYADSSKSARIK